MKFALVNGERQEAKPTLTGACPGCGGPVIAKCGEVRVRHWSHKGQPSCDPWWENETDWHRAWKDKFPLDWQEIVHRAGDGERHIADVKTGAGWVIEFQHSYLNPEERRSREAFYPKLLWVVDGMRRKRDRAQFIRVWNEGAPVVVSLLRKAYSEDCGLLREWASGSAPIFVDLGETDALWCLLAKSTNGWAYIHPVSRAQFIEWHCSPTTESARQLAEFLSEMPTLIAAKESSTVAHAMTAGLTSPRRVRRPFRF